MDHLKVSNVNGATVHRRLSCLSAHPLLKGAVLHTCSTLENKSLHEEIMVGAVEVCCLLVVAVLWGATNPFLKKGTEGIERVKKGNIVLQFLAEVKFLFLNFKYLIPFLLNQGGSMVYYFTLATTELSLAVPVVNSLTFLITLLTGSLLGEDFGGKRAVFGMLLTMLGVSLCIFSSASEANQISQLNTTLT